MGPKKQTSTTYVHQELNQETVAIGGSFVLTREVRILFHGRDLFYLTGYGTFDTSCCGAGGCVYATVPGFILEWKNKTNKERYLVSEVEPVRDKTMQEELRKLIQEKENVHQINFQ